MIITTISNEGINTVSLPQKIKGQYYLYETNKKEVLTSVEGINENWVLKSNRYVKIVDGQDNVIKNLVMDPNSVYVLKKNNSEKIYVYTEPVTANRQIYTKYLFKEDVELSIGRAEENDIRLNSGVVSSSHAKLSFISGKWSICDLNSTNGTFVNDKKITKTELNFGDVIFIMGFKIVVGKNIIAINNPDDKVEINKNIRMFIKQQNNNAVDDEEYTLEEQSFFYRSPRFKRNIETAKFKIDAPPNSPISDEMPWMLVIGSSMAMGVMSVVTLVNAILSSNITSIVMGGSMLIGTVFLPIITKRYEKKKRYKKEALRQRKYREYLDKVSVQINEACQIQEEIHNENNVTIINCENRIKNIQSNLWERLYGQNDFLRIRLGLGNGLLDADISYNERKFSIDDDNLQEELYALCENNKILNNIPITYSVAENTISGVIGRRNEVIEFAKGMIFQLAALYGYDEVKFVVLYDSEETEQLEFVKWLPHVWSDDKKFRFIATNVNEAKEVSAYLENIIENRIQLNENDLDEVKPYFVVFSFSKSLALRTENIKKIFALKNNIHFSVITFYNQLRNLPKECSMVVELDGKNGKVFDKNDTSCKTVTFTPDIYLTQNPLELSRILSNVYLDNENTDSKLPHLITFLEMFGVGKVEHLNSLNRWKENDPTKSLKAEVGVDVYGDLFTLDLHEKFHGPHGLVAGMTGSGKSEFIITYILSLAVNYHPYEVAFILIDYKGGGMAKSFERLPHTAGIITNLDGAAIKRSLVSIDSELKRRQAIFADVSKKVGVSNIDIYKYQKLFREGKVDEPLQHLFIISDEFAELKTQQPEFMTQLVSAARIGRSLGVHLILATQKPSGVVDDQIWSNSKFRVCLKVQERADSMDMLKRADAAELTDTGRFYLQVGYNELFEMGQSAWAGALYYPSEKLVKERDDSVVVIDNNGHPIKQVKFEKKQLNDNAKKQLDVITEYLEQIAEEEKIQIKPLWLEPISPVIFIEQLKEKYHDKGNMFVLNPLIGEYDDPIHQRQCAMHLPLSNEGNVVVYGVAGSGKTSFLNAMIYSLIKEHTPEEVNLYILDFASETLRAFSKAPHVGDVVLSYESEKVNNLLKMLYGEIEKRKKLFSDYGGDYRSYIENSETKIPSIVVAIANYAAFSELYQDNEDAISYLSREGTKYGIYFVLTALSTGAVRFRLLQNFKQLIVLQLNDEADYSTVVGKTDGLFPSKHKGRGLVKYDELYEFQIASLTDDNNPYAYISTCCKEISDKWNGVVAKKIPILPEKVNMEFLSEYVNDNKKINIPIGVEKNSLNVHMYPFSHRYINCVLSMGNEYQGFFDNLVEFIDKSFDYNCTVLDISKTIKYSVSNVKVYKNSSECEEIINEIFDTVLYRNNSFKDTDDKEKLLESFDPMLIIINSIATLKNTISDVAKEKLGLILEKGSSEYKINIIFGETATNISSLAYEKWYKSNVSSSDGIWIGNGFTQQYHLKANKTTQELHEEITSEFGYVLNSGKVVKVKLLSNIDEVEIYE